MFPPYLRFLAIFLVISVYVHSAKADCFWTECLSKDIKTYCPAATTLSKSTSEGCQASFVKHKCCRGPDTDVFPEALGPKYKIQDGSSSGQLESPGGAKANLHQENVQGGPVLVTSGREGGNIETAGEAPISRPFPPPQLDVTSKHEADVTLTDEQVGFFSGIRNFFG